MIMVLILYPDLSSCQFIIDILWTQHFKKEYKGQRRPLLNVFVPLCLVSLDTPVQLFGKRRMIGNFFFFFVVIFFQFFFLQNL